MSTTITSKNTKKRFMELDLARGSAIFFMVFVHVLEMYGQSSVFFSSFGRVIFFFGSPPAAPMFMILMGMGLVYSRNQSASLIIYRGAYLFLLGFLLNIVRYLIPFLLGTSLGFLHYQALWDVPILHLLTEIDILPFAGLALMFFGLLRRMKLPFSAYPIIALCFSLLSNWAIGFQSGNTILDWILFPFVSNAYNAYFPFVVWIVYPLLGFFLGSLLQRKRDSRGAFYKSCAIIGLLGFGLAYLLSRSDPEVFLAALGLAPEPWDYFTHGSLGHLTIISFLLVWLAGFYKIGPKLPQWIQDKLAFWSQSITSFYFIHWAIIGFSMIFIGMSTLSWPEVLLAMLLVMVLADRGTNVYLSAFPNGIWKKLRSKR